MFLSSFSFSPFLAAPARALILSGGLLLAVSPAARADGGLFTVTKPAFGLVDGQLFAGEGTGSVDGTGTLSVRAQAGPDGAVPQPPIACEGKFDHDFKTGHGTLSCSNGETADFTFRFTGLTRGVGEGESKAHGPIRFTFGLDAAEAARELKLPEGARIVALGAGADGQPAFRLEEAGAPAGAAAGPGSGPLPSPASRAVAPGAEPAADPAPASRS